jgi:hypothetical protein
MTQRPLLLGNGYPISRNLCPRLVDLSGLTTLGRQTRKHPPDQVHKLQASIAQFGLVLPIIIDNAGRVVAGWGLVLAAKNLGLQKIPAITVTDLREAQLHARESNPDGIFGKDSLAKAIDLKFVDTIISDGSVDSIPSSGSTLSAIASDLATAMALINLGANSKVYLIAPPKWIRAVALTRTSGGAPAFPGLEILGGSISGIAVLPSDALTDTVLLLDAAQCAVDVGPIIPDKTTQSVLQLNDDPSDGGQMLTSLWQSNLTAIRFERWWGFALLASDAAVKITNVAIDQGTGT